MPVILPILSALSEVPQDPATLTVGGVGLILATTTVIKIASHFSSTVDFFFSSKRRREELQHLIAAGKPVEIRAILKQVPAEWKATVEDHTRRIGAIEERLETESRDNRVRFDRIVDRLNAVGVGVAVLLERTGRKDEHTKSIIEQLTSDEKERP